MSVNESDGDAALRCSMSRHGLALVLLEGDPSGRAFVRMNGGRSGYCSLQVGRSIQPTAK